MACSESHCKIACELGTQRRIRYVGGESGMNCFEICLYPAHRQFYQKTWRIWQAIRDFVKKIDFQCGNQGPEERLCAEIASAEKERQGAAGAVWTCCYQEKIKAKNIKPSCPCPSLKRWYQAQPSRIWAGENHRHAPWLPGAWCLSDLILSVQLRNSSDNTAMKRATAVKALPGKVVSHVDMTVYGDEDERILPVDMLADAGEGRPDPAANTVWFHVCVWAVGNGMGAGQVTIIRRYHRRGVKAWRDSGAILAPPEGPGLVAAQRSWLPLDMRESPLCTYVVTPIPLSGEQNRIRSRHPSPPSGGKAGYLRKKKAYRKKMETPLWEKALETGE